MELGWRNSVKIYLGNPSQEEHLNEEYDKDGKENAVKYTNETDENNTRGRFLPKKESKLKDTRMR